MPAWFLFKKTLRASEQEREDIKEARVAWSLWQKQVDINSLVFIDESSAKTNMCKLYGRSKRGERCHGKAHASWTTTTMISSIRINGSTECLVFEGSVERKMFRAYMREMLLPVLKRGDIVVLDNLSTHKDTEILNYFALHGITLLYLPTYSPDLNPIEKMWSKIKGILRERAAETTDALFEAIRAAFERITPENAKGWFESCGYFQL
jgi:transposase